MIHSICITLIAKVVKNKYGRSSSKTVETPKNILIKLESNVKGSMKRSCGIVIKRVSVQEMQT